MSLKAHAWGIAGPLFLLAALAAGCHGPQRCCPARGPAPGGWAGIYPTVVTPLCECGVDTVSLERQLRHELAGGVHGLLVLGTIGEGQYARPDERAGRTFHRGMRHQQVDVDHGPRGWCRVVA